VLDVDRPDGLAVLDDELPETPRIRTPRGGVHFPFRHVEGVTNSPGALPEGIDVRGEGGFVLVPRATGTPSSTGLRSRRHRVAAAAGQGAKATTIS
jgi:hypothetical protein